jgi:hypothetical protein
MTSLLQIVVRFVRHNWFTLVLFVGLLAAWLLLHDSSTTLASVNDFDQRVQAARPTVVHLFSNT